ncbi:MAG: hypothetical protein QNJ31_06220 [Candidatus Caenarcaniphilales bacterium]|nr:hypothetical protein [Candidatus Caenarcaniphilales bacterium]
MELEIKLLEKDEEINGILELQQKNLPHNLSKDETVNQGFLTVIHFFDLLNKMNKEEKSVIAKDKRNRVIGYCLAMTKDLGSTIEILKPFFFHLNELIIDNKSLNEFKVIYVGQACIQKEYRGMNLLSKMYAKYKEYFVPRYEIAVTEILQRNIRSMSAHQKIGFQPLDTYIAPNDEVCDIVFWDWRESPKNKIYK